MNEVGFRATEFFGAWLLISLNAIRPNGETTTGWLGKRPSGLLVYDPSGFLSVQIMSDPREPYGHDPENLAVHAHYYAYFGTFEIDERSKTITHHVRGSLRPDEIGLIYQQTFTLSDDQLTLLTATHVVAGEERRNLITWRRGDKSGGR
jgi:hypothetical protein